MKSLLIRSISLPAQIKGAIENKLQQEQEALAYQLLLFAQLLMVPLHAIHNLICFNVLI